jgi:ABC-type Na+ transport system ATPase subunit NatA
MKQKNLVLCFNSQTQSIVSRQTLLQSRQFLEKSFGNAETPAAKGITILVSTPYMDEAALCDQIALIQKGSY